MSLLLQIITVTGTDVDTGFNEELDFQIVSQSPGAKFTLNCAYSLYSVGDVWRVWRERCVECMEGEMCGGWREGCVECVE